MKRWAVGLAVVVGLVVLVGVALTAIDGKSADRKPEQEAPGRLYEASAWIRIYAAPPYIAFKPEESVDEWERYIQGQIELVRSPVVLEPVLSHKSIADLREIQQQEDPVSWLAERVRMVPVGKSDLFKISYSSPNSENSARVVNAVVDEYFNQHGRNEAEREHRIIELLEVERERRAGEVHRLRENVRQLAKQTEKRGEETLELELARMDLDLSKDVLRRITQRVLMLRTEQRAPRRIVLLKKAETPRVPVEVNR